MCILSIESLLPHWKSAVVFLLKAWTTNLELGIVKFENAFLFVHFKFIFLYVENACSYMSAKSNKKSCIGKQIKDKNLSSFLFHINLLVIFKCYFIILLFLVEKKEKDERLKRKHSTQITTLCFRDIKQQTALLSFLFSCIFTSLLVFCLFSSELKNCHTEENTKHKSHNDEWHESPSSSWLFFVVNPCCVGVAACGRRYQHQH